MTARNLQIALASSFALYDQSRDSQLADERVPVRLTITMPPNVGKAKNYRNVRTAFSARPRAA